MDRELEDQIDQLFNKTLVDLKTKIARLILKHEKKLVKDFSKSAISSSAKPSKRNNKVAPVPRASVKGKGVKGKYHSEGSESDSDYYSD